MANFWLNFTNGLAGVIDNIASWEPLSNHFNYLFATPCTYLHRQTEYHLIANLLGVQRSSTWEHRINVLVVQNKIF